MNKLDLIFEKQPPQVQRKLVNLLIQYNAMMQYNQKQDKFEVDLLLPFKTAKQKQQFIQNYKSRPHKKQINQISKREDSFSVKQHLNHSYNHNNYSSFRNQEQHQWPQQTKKPNQLQHYNNEIQELAYPQRSEQAQISYQLTNQNNYSMSQRRKTLSLRDLSINIKSRIQKAVQQIKKQQNNSKNKINSNEKNVQNNQFNKNQQNNSFKLNRVLMEQYQYAGEDRSTANRQQNHNKNNFLQVQPQMYSTAQGQIIKQQQKNNNSFMQNSRSSNQSSQIKNQILIQQLQDQKNNANNYNQMPNSDRIRHINNKSRQKQFDSRGRILSDHKQKIYQTDINPNLSNQEQFSYKSGEKQPIESHDIAMYQKIQSENVNQMKKKLTQKYGSKKINNTNIRQKYSEFLKKNHRDFNRIYDTIKKQIRRNQTKLMKTRKEDPILVLQQDLSEAYTQQDRIFKEQIIKDYQKHIIAENQNMSSEDLVRYFRYLLQNAKTLYVKHLRKGR